MVDLTFPLPNGYPEEFSAPQAFKEENFAWKTGKEYGRKLETRLNF